MADDIIVGSVAVDVNASTKGFIADIRAKVEPGVRQLADNLGKMLEDKIAAGIGKGMGQGFAPAETVSKQKGKQSGENFGGEFGRQAQIRIRAALAALPEAKIGVAKTEAEQKLKDLRAEIAALGDKRIGIDISATEAHAKITELQARLVVLGSQSPEIDVQVNTAKAAAELAAFGAAIDPLTDGSSGLPAVASGAGRAGSSLGSLGTTIAPLILGVAGLAAAAGPLAAALGGITAALAAPIGAAAAGGTLYALFAGKAIKDVSKISKEIDTLRKKAATLQDPKAAQQARDQANALEESLTGPQRKFLKAREELSRAFSKIMDGPVGSAVFGPLTSGMELLEKLLPNVTPLLTETSEAVSDLIDGLAKKSGGSKEFFESLGQLAGDGIRDGGRALGNIAESIASIVGAGAEDGASALDSIADATERLNKYLKSPEGQKELEDFFEWLRTDGKDIGEDVLTIAGYFIDWFMAAAKVGDTLLDIAAGGSKVLSFTARLSKRIQDTVDSWDVFGKSARLARRALGGIVDATASVMSTFADMLRVIGKVPGFGWAKKAARDMDKAADNARGLAKDIRGIPGKKTVFVKAETAEAKRAIKNLVSEAEKFVVNLPIVGSKAGKNAKGTPYWKGGWTWVGEEGPELLKLPQGSAIKSNPDSMSMVRAAQQSSAVSILASQPPAYFGGGPGAQPTVTHQVVSVDMNAEGYVELLIESAIDNYDSTVSQVGGMGGV